MRPPAARINPSGPAAGARPPARRLTAPHVRKGLGARFGGQSGALQGLSDLEGAASESVDELLEEGNAFEAEIVKGVEDAGNDGERPVPIHRVTEDDVPEQNVPDEYFRKE